MKLVIQSPEYTEFIVAPFAGAWIETRHVYRHRKEVKSLPSRERGLKRKNGKQNKQAEQVAPFAGAWIETLEVKETYDYQDVAPFAGAWIETVEPEHPTPAAGSRSLRGSVD